MTCPTKSPEVNQHTIRDILLFPRLKKLEE